MEKRARSIRLAAAMMMIVLLLCGAAAAYADADPIRVSSLSEPQSVISEQDVSITIKIYNSSQTDMEETIVLYNPEGKSVEKYEGLKGEQSVTYTGTWHVTADQISKGKINYFIRYTVDTGSGPQETTRTIPVTIQTEAAAPQLSATYSISPASAREGQVVTLSYTLSNTGNIELRNITIENEGVTKKNVVAPSLSVGEKITLEDSFTMGTKELVSKPTITYQAAGSNKTLTISDMARKTITVAEDGLEVTLSAKETEGIYPGENVEMTLEMKNSGNTAYTGLSAQLSTGMAVTSGVELAPGASFKHEFEAPVAQSGTLTVSVTGADSTGETVGVISNELAVTTQDASRALMLNISAQAQTDVIHSEPAVVRFGVVVQNVGQTDATSLVVKQAGTTVYKIPSLPSGESKMFVIDLETSIAGKFQFVVTGNDADGNSRSYESNILQVTYVQPTPTPTAVPTPTPVPPTPTPVPTPTPEPTLGEIINQHVNPVVLYAAAGMLAAILAAILIAGGVSSARRKKREANAIDTIELTPDVRDHRGRRRTRKAQKKSPEELEPVVPATELTDEAPVVHETEEKPAEPKRRRSAGQEIPTDETLRVAPVDERPEFVAQGRVDDSRTRVFGRIEEPAPAVKQPPVAPAPAEPAVLTEEPVTAMGGETVRLTREQTQELRKAAKGKGSTRKEIKPMKKRGLFGKRKAEEEEDFFLDEDEFEDSDDDFFE